MKNLKIKTRLILFVVIICVFFVSMFGLSIASLGDANERLANIMEGPVETQDAVLKCELAAEIAAVSVRDMLLVNSTGGDLAAAKATATASIADLQTNYDALLAAQDTESALVTQLGTVIDNWTTSTESVIANIDSGNVEAAISTMVNEEIALQHELEQLSSQIIEENEAALAADFASAERYTSSTFIFFTVLLVVILLVSLFMFISLVRSIVTPLKEMEKVANSLSKGDFSTNLTYQSKDEIGVVAAAMREMCANLNLYMSDLTGNMSEIAKGRLNIHSQVQYQGDFVALAQGLEEAVDAFNHTLNQISKSADEVSENSDQVASGAQMLSQGSIQQASAVEQLAATITEVSGQMQESADNAKFANDKVTQTGSEIELTQAKMRELISAMGDISSCSDEIAKIIKTIEDISFQTNLLALNAAVEAARAGAAGKGFAVVADEVRNLASKSAEASKDTAVLIGNTRTAVKNGVDLANQAAGSLVTVVENTSEVTTVINKISDSSSQQAVAAGQVTLGIEQISSVVQTTSATAEESAATSQELSSQARLLRSLVDAFELQDENRPARIAAPQQAQAPQLASAPFELPEAPEPEPFSSF